MRAVHCERSRDLRQPAVGADEHADAAEVRLEHRVGVAGSEPTRVEVEQERLIVATDDRAVTAEEERAVRVATAGHIERQSDGDVYAVLARLVTEACCGIRRRKHVAVREIAGAEQVSRVRYFWQRDQVRSFGRDRLIDTAQRVRQRRFGIFDGEGRELEQ